MLRIIKQLGWMYFFQFMLKLDIYLTCAKSCNDHNFNATVIFVIIFHWYFGDYEVFHV